MAYKQLKRETVNVRTMSTSETAIYVVPGSTTVTVLRLMERRDAHSGSPDYDMRIRDSSNNLLSTIVHRAGITTDMTVSSDVLGNFALRPGDKITIQRTGGTNLQAYYYIAYLEEDTT